MTSRLLSFAFILSCFSFQLQAQTYELLDAEVLFEIDNAGITVDGHFEQAPQLTLDLKRKNYDKMQLNGQLAARSIHTGIGIRDKHLMRSDYFDVEHYPDLRMQSNTFVMNKDGKLQGSFLLTIKDIEKAVEVLITPQLSGDTLELQGTFSIRRQDFGLGDDSMILSDDVHIMVNAHFLK